MHELDVQCVHTTDTSTADNSVKLTMIIVSSSVVVSVTSMIAVRTTYTLVVVMLRV
jgi:hypothetical protein